MELSGPVVETNADHGKVTSLDAFGDCVYVGTSDGKLLLYRTEVHDDDGQRQRASSVSTGSAKSGGYLSGITSMFGGKKGGKTDDHGAGVETTHSDVSYVSTLEVKQSLGKRPVDQIRAFAEISKLVALCDGQLTIHKLDTLEQMGSVPSARGASLFAPDHHGPWHRLAVAVKKRLLLYEYVSDYVLYRELMLPDVAVGMSWYSPSLLLAFKREYSIINDDTGDATELVPVDGAGRPVVVTLPREGEFVVRVGAVGVAVGLGGEPSSRTSLDFPSPPTHLAVSHPYTVALTPDTLSFRNLYTSGGEDIPFRGGVAIGGGWDTRGGDTGHGSALLGTRVLVGTSHRVYALRPVPFDVMVGRLVAEGKVSQGIELYTRTRERQDDPDAYDMGLQSVYELGGKVLLETGDFEDAFRLLARTKVPPEGVIALYEGLLPEGDRGDQAAARFVKEARVIVNGEDAPAEGAPTWERIVEEEKGLVNELASLPKPALSIREIITRALDPSARPKNVSELRTPLVLAGEEATPATPPHPSQPRTTDSMYRSALLHLQTFLLARRSPPGYQPGDGDIGKGKGKGKGNGNSGTSSASNGVSAAASAMAVDTALVKVLAMTGDMDALRSMLLGASGAPPPNCCSLSDLPPQLLRRHRPEALAVLLASKGMWDAAIRVWKSMAESHATGSGGSSSTSSTSITSAPTGMGGVAGGNDGNAQSADASGSTSLMGPSSTSTSPSKGARGSIPGVAETVEYLTHKGTEQQVWKHSQWVLAVAPDEALRIFTGLSSEGTPRLAPPKVLSHLAQHAPHLQQSYLESLIATAKGVGAEYHTRLVMMYLERVTRAGAVSARAGDEGGLLGQVRTRLMGILARSDKYDVHAVLDKVRGTRLHDECVVLHGKLGRHDEALRILVFELNDMPAAERYCFDRWDRAANPGATPPLLTTLLSVLLRGNKNNNNNNNNSASNNARNANSNSSGGSGNKSGGSGSSTPPSLDPRALSLLRRYPLPPSTLDLLPADLPLPPLLPFLSSIIRTSASKCRTMSVFRNLARVEAVEARWQRRVLTGGYVEVRRGKVCEKCGISIGDKVFAVYPNGVVVHFKCFKDRNVCPVTGEVFGKR